MFDSAVNLDAHYLAPLCDAAKRHAATVDCGLHELVSNAYRHGCGAGAAGREILVRVASLPNGRIVLQVKDNGRGLPADFDPGKRVSLGMQLVATLSRRPGVELSWDAGGPGACFTLQFKPEVLTTRRMAV